MIDMSTKSGRIEHLPRFVLVPGIAMLAAREFMAAIAKLWA